MILNTLYTILSYPIIHCYCSVIKNGPHNLLLLQWRRKGEVREVKEEEETSIPCFNICFKPHEFDQLPWCCLESVIMMLFRFHFMMTTRE